MAMGIFASRQLLQKYKLEYFIPICRAVHRGDLKAFEEQLALHQQVCEMLCPKTRRMRRIL